MESLFSDTLMAHRYDSLECLGQQLGVLSQVYCELLLQQFLLFLQLDVLQQLLRERQPLV